MTFNNRIAMRNMTKHHSTYEAGTLRARQPTDISIEVNTFQASYTSYPGQPDLMVESYEIDVSTPRLTASSDSN